MDYRYHTLTTVTFRHTYFAGNRYTGFVVEPDAETQHHFKRLSLLFKARPDGFTILYETGPGLERTREKVLEEGLVFGFVINNTDSGFVSYTDFIPVDISRTILHLRNQTKPGSGNEGVMHADNYFTAKDTLQNQPPDEKNPDNRSFFVKPFAWMQIALHKGLEDNLVVNFKGKETVWRYILSSEHLFDLSEPAIIHKDTKEAFKGPVYVHLPTGEKRMAFESLKPLPLSNRSEKTYQLVENFQQGSSRYRVVISVLPNPDIRSISLIKGERDDENIFSEIFI